MSKETNVEIFDAWLDARLRNVHTCIPGKIESYSGHTTRKATVKPLVKIRTVIETELSIPPIDNVPVVFPSSTTFSLLYPLKRGDGCMILFSEEGIGAYLKGQTEVVADSLARFQLTDAICIPGMWSFKSVPASTSTIEIDSSGNINLNGSTRNLVSHTELNVALQTMLTLINATFATKLNGAGAAGVNTLDISTAKINTVRAGT